jgi:hypothetical protein
MMANLVTIKKELTTTTALALLMKVSKLKPTEALMDLSGLLSIPGWMMLDTQS